MKSFVAYFLERLELEEVSLFSESAKKEDAALHFYEKYPNLQYKDIEDAFEEAPKTKSFMSEVDKILANANSKKKKASRHLSCLKSIKRQVPDGEEKTINKLMSRAEKLLTNQEKKVLMMCSSGRSVRQMGAELGLSHPTAWRVLNSAIDKIRISHGLKPRHLDVRRKKKES